MSYMGDVCAITGRYTDQSGQEKNRYIRVGAWFQSDKGISVKLEAIPYPNGKGGEVWLSLFVAQQQQQRPPQQQQQRPPQQQQQQQQQPQHQQQRPPQGGGYY